MKYSVIKVEDNRNYLENKSYTLEEKNENGFLSISNNILAFCDRIWFDSQISFKIGHEYVYEIMQENGDVWETMIIEKGKDECGNYVVVIVPKILEHLHEGKERLCFSLGKIDVKIILSPNMIKGAKQFLDEFNGRWPSFHDVSLKIIDKSASETILRFSGAYLFDKVVSVIARGIISEDYDDVLYYFSTQWITNLEFRNYNNIFELKFYNDYYEGENKFENHGLIRCEEIEIITTIDEVEKENLKRLYEGLTSVSASE